MRNVLVFITGLIKVTIAFIVLIVGLVLDQSNYAIIKLIITTAILCLDKKSKYRSFTLIPNPLRSNNKYYFFIFIKILGSKNI